MNITRIGLILAGAIGFVLGFGCTPQKPVTDRDRKEAALLVSEAQFAMNLREWSRAEGLLAKAVQLDPQGDVWLSLGAVRIHLGKRSGAKDAYQSALKSYEFEATRNNLVPEPWIKQAYVLGLLGRKDDSRALIKKTAQRFPNDGKVRALTDPKEFERMFSTPKFKEMSL